MRDSRPRKIVLPYRRDTASATALVADSGVEAGASGNSSGSLDLSTGGLIAIVVVVAVVSVVGSE